MTDVLSLEIPKDVWQFLRVVIFWQGRALSEDLLLETIRKLGIIHVKILPHTQMESMVPGPKDVVWHIYGYVGDETGWGKFVTFSEHMHKKDARPHFFALAPHVRDIPFVATGGHFWDIRALSSSDFEMAVRMSAHKIYLQEQGRYFHERWHDLKRLSNETNEEVFRFQQEQNDFIRFTKQLRTQLLPSDVLKTACTYLKEVFHLSGIAFWKYEDASDTLRFVCGEGQHATADPTKPTEVHLHGKRDPTTYFVSYVEQPDFGNCIAVSSLSHKMVPVLDKEEVLGVFVWYGAETELSHLPTHFLDQMMSYFAISYANALLHEKIVDMAMRDGLTGLYNVRYFYQRLTAEFSRMERLKHPLGILFLDIDHFKHYNDTHGHPSGDRLLKMIAQIIGKIFRPTDIIARYGGEEFVVALPHAALADATERAGHLCEQIATTEFPHEETQPLGKLTVSIGVSAFPEVANDAKTLLKSADDALYVAKNAGRNQYQVAHVPKGHVPLYQPRFIRG